MLKFLLEKGMDINGLGLRSGISALHTAVLENNESGMRLLLSNGANPFLKDGNEGKTPLQFALDRKGKPNQPDRTAIIRLLENATKS